MPSAKPHADVATGEVGTTRGGVLTVGALGSCVAVVALDLDSRIGGIAHVMLPGAAPRRARAPRTREPRTRYAEDGIRRLLDELRGAGASAERLAICLVGGADVLRRGDDTIGADNIASVRRVLAGEGLAVAAAHLGGFDRRGCVLDAASGRVSCSLGDGPPRVLWEAKSRNRGGDNG